MFTHEDDRRKLIEWATGNFKTAKVLIAKAGCVVGDHYHKNKDEEFLLLTGGALLDFGDRPPYRVTAMTKIDVQRGTYHCFELDEGSILLGVGTEEFDPNDEIKGRPS